ncbi:MAG: F0F1 ATP synthase subunit B [Clostridia bacterium]|nr:F0F1 ATP synthase subunit B [Clostridia bacterium]
MQTLEVISINIWNILISLANLIIMFLVLKKFLFAPVKAIFASREAQVQEKYDRASEALERADENCALYEEKLAMADEEVDAILHDARDRADRLEQEIVSEAQNKAASMIRRADAQIAQEKKKAVNEIKNEISAMSVDIAERMIGREIKEEDHEALIDEFISGIGE